MKERLIAPIHINLKLISKADKLEEKEDSTAMQYYLYMAC